MKIKKSIKKPGPTPTDISALAERIVQASEEQLVPLLSTIDRWQFPRGDLHAWISVLDRFDTILEEIIASYHLDRLQANDFTPKTKELLSHVLRVQRLLLENSTNRRLFASYDRLASLLFTSDLDILSSAIFLLLRPAQQYASQTPLESSKCIILSRLQTLTRGWEVFSQAGISLADAVHAPLTEELRHVEIQYYPEVTMGPAAPNSHSQPTPRPPHHTSMTINKASTSTHAFGPSTLDLGDATKLSANHADHIALLAETHHIPLDSQFAAWHRARLLTTDNREQLLTVRLLSLATYVYLAPDDSAQTDVFVYEPDLVQELTDLLKTTPTMSDIRTAALLALQACALDQTKSNEIMTALCSNVNHGIIVVHLRGLVERLVNGADVPNDLVDATMGIIAHISASSIIHRNMLMAAGIFRILLDMLATVGPWRDNYIPRATGLIDSIIFATTVPALSNFSNVDGVNALVHRVKFEIDTITVPPAHAYLSQSTMVASTSNPLKGLLRSLHRLMQASGGTEGMRNLVDSDLPKSLKRMFEDPDNYGPRAYALAINLMATFVHNEPTSLSILQELGLPQTLYTQLEKGIPAYYEVIFAVSSAIGAVCLNQVGLDYTQAHPQVIIYLVKTSTSALVDEPGNRERQLGSSLDELGRHHPALRPLIIGAIIQVLREATDLGASYDPPADQRSEYLLHEMVHQRSKISPSNPCLIVFTRIFKVLSGLLRNVSTTKDFLKEGGLRYLLGVAELPCLPIRFGATDTAIALTHLFKHIGEHEHVILVDAIVASISDDMRLCVNLWQVDSSSAWLALQSGATLEPSVTTQFEALRTLGVRLTLLTDTLFALSASHGRIATSVIKSLRGIRLSDLARLHRTCIQQHVELDVNRGQANTEEASESGAKFLATRLHVVLTKYFTCVVRFIFVKRNTDPAHAKEAATLANDIARILMELQDLKQSASTDAVALGVITSLLFDGHGVEGHLNTTLFISFVEQGGLESLNATNNRIIDRMDSDSTVAENVGSLKVALSLMQAMVASRALTESSETHALEARSHSHFAASDLLVVVRLALFPLVCRVWNAPWLSTCPVPIIKIVIRAFTSLIKGKSETAHDPLVSTDHVPVAVAPARPLLVVDPARVDQLVDMGFPRGPSERALLRARNNVAAATDLMLSVPHMFEAEVPVPPAPAAEPEAVHEDEGTGEGLEAEHEATANPQAENASDITVEDSSLETGSTVLLASRNIAGKRQELKQLRMDIGDTARAQRALVLLDHAEDLVFDLLSFFPTGQTGVDYLIDRLNDVAIDYSTDRAKVLSARLRLTSVYLRTAEHINLDRAAIEKAASILSNLPLDLASRPHWIPAFLLFAEVTFASSLAVVTVKIGDSPDLPILDSTTSIGAARTRLATICTELVGVEDVSRDEIMAALRLLALLSRSADNGRLVEMKAILKPFKKPSDKLAGCHTFLAMILRHTFEDSAEITSVIRSEIHEWLSPSRTKVTDINHFIKQFRQAVSRDAACFVTAVEQECALVDPTPPQAVFHIRGQEATPTSQPRPSSPDPFHDNSGQNIHPAIDFMLSELSEAVSQSLASSSITNTAETLDTHTYTALLMSLLTELVGSYVSAKKCFLASAKQLTVKTRGISSIVNDLVCCVILNPDVTQPEQAHDDSARRLAVSSWASSLIVALCSDAPGENRHEELALVRKTVLDVVAKALRDVGSYPDRNIRYGRLWALGELVHRLLTARSRAASRSPNEDSVHVAKIMLEKNFVSLFTSALGEVDLNYPDVRNVVVSLLRSLENLSKLSVKWGKVNKPKEDVSEDSGDDQEDESTSDEGEFDVDMLDEDEMAPDLYRNSALGMIGRELGDDEDDEDDEDEDDEDMDMGDDLTDDDDGTATHTTEEESLAEALEHEEWDEEMAEDLSEGEEMDPEVLLGPADEGEWEDAPDDQTSATENEDADGDDVDEDDEEGPFFGDDDEEDEMIDMEMDMDDGEEFDEFHMFDVAPQSDVQPSHNATGPWGWDHHSGTSGRHRSILMDDPAVSLFGAPQRPGPNATEHPLITNPSLSQAASRNRNWPRAFGQSPHDLLTAINGLAGPEAVRVLRSLLTSRHLNGREAVAVEFVRDNNGHMGLSVGGRFFNLPAQAQQDHGPSTDLLSEFLPVPTQHRWQDESSLFPPAQNSDIAARIVVHIVNRLMPAARLRAEEEEKQGKARQEQEIRAAAEAAEEAVASAANVALPASRQPSPEAEERIDEDVSMDNSPDEPVTLARTIVSIHGRDVDITDTGIDLEFLQALPDDMRADVVEQHMREQNRTQRPPAPGVPPTASQINSEFLDALPPDIRAEVIMQEAMESARRNANTQANTRAVEDRVAGAGGSARFLASLSDELRDVMLLGQHTDGLDLSRLGGAPTIDPRATAPDPKKRHREAIQLLDKPGLASLVRLLFFPATLKKGHLFKVLVNMCGNSTSRADLLNLLLSVVQDGTGDLPAVDRSFQQMSIRSVNNATPKITPKATKVVDSPAAVVPSGLFAHLQSEHVPSFITQRCFEALLFIVNSNSDAAAYFLEEHEQPVSIRRPQSKKGKGKEKIIPQTKFPIVILLGLLDRPLLAKPSGLMETITAILVTVTKSLTAAKPEKPLPSIPPTTLRLIVNCLTCGECNSRTFSQTLVVMQNLSTLPDVKDVILQELQARCRELGSTVHTELEEMASALQVAATEIKPSLLDQFSSPTAKQAQLLRLLKTIDYLLQDKVSETGRSSAEPTDAERAASTVFESLDFASLWEQLGRCLTQVEGRENSDQTAMVLLPLVEALMVVSKYRKSSSRSSSIPPSSTVDTSDLFTTFTTAHRKILNTIVRNNPTLLSGSFSLLIRNPRVLEFDNKRHWFFQKLKRKRDSNLPSHVLPVNVRRQYVFNDSFHALQIKTGDEIKYGKLSVKFRNEDGVDAGGVTREWYSVLAQQIFDPNFVLFEPCAADKQTYQPNKASSVNHEHLTWFKFVGRIIGKAVYDGRLLDAYFSRAFYKQILGKTVDMRDLESIDPEYHKSLQWMLDNDITGVIDQEFTIEDDQFGEKKIVELKDGGSSIPVTEENKEEYVRLVVSYRLDNSIKDQIKAFLEGFYDIIPRDYIQIFEPDQLELLISGITTIDVDELKNATHLSGWKATDPEIAWFWRALRSYSQEERSRFLMFVTSSSRVPLGGFAQLQGSSGVQPFQIQKLYATEGSLPQASTCFNLLLLPSYASYEQLRDRLQFAIVETGGFGKA